jgi:adenine/guanine phosphoribosyltransferase-like PRPP-binding protein
MTQDEAEPWQAFVPRTAEACAMFTSTYPADLPDGTCLELPLRDLGGVAVAGLIANQASFAVLDRLTIWLTDIARPFDPDIVVGLPTLGHVFGAGVARALGHTNWVAPGTTRKLWYDEALSVPLSSVTSPGIGRRLWLDPRLLPRLRGRRVLMIDDVISTGASVNAALDLMRIAGVEPVAVCAAMLQGERWRDAITAHTKICGVFASPRFDRTQNGWRIRPSTEMRANCPLLTARST